MTFDINYTLQSNLKPLIVNCTSYFLWPHSGSSRGFN